MSLIPSPKVCDSYSFRPAQIYIYCPLSNIKLNICDAIRQNGPEVAQTKFLVFYIVVLCILMSHLAENAKKIGRLVLEIQAVGGFAKQ